MSSVKHKKISIKDHPFLRQAQQQNQAKFSDFLQRINGSKLSNDQKKAKKQIEQSKSTFVKLDKGVKVNNQPRRYLPKIIDLNQTKKDKKIEKLARKDSQRLPTGSNTTSGNPLTSQQRLDRQINSKNKPLYKPKVYDDQLDQQRLDDYQQDQPYQEELDPQANQQLAKMLGKFRSSKYRDRDKGQIIQSRQDDIQREEKYSKMIAMKQDMEQEMIRRRQRQQRQQRKLLKKNKLKRLEQKQGDDGDSKDKNQEEPRMRVKDKVMRATQQNYSDNDDDD